MAEQLFYGKLSGVTPIGSGSNSYIRVTGDFNTASKTITNVTDVGGVYLGLEFVRPGQTLVSTGPFSSGTTVVSVDTGAATITVAEFPATTETKLARISPADGDYYIASASFFDANNQTPITFKNITGSEDSNYNSSTPIYAIIGASANPSNGLTMPGR